MVSSPPGSPNSRKRRRRKVLRPRSVRGITPYTSEEVYDLLAGLYAAPARPRHADGTAELIETILSQHTSDTNAERAFAALADRYPTWAAVVDAPTGDLEETIRSGGLARQKAPRIQDVLRSVHVRTGGYDIDFLGSMEPSEAKAWLQELPGVGPKTAGVVLSFAYGLPAMAVDTHIHRVTRRLGLIGPKVTADEAHDVLEPTIAPERVLGFHVSSPTAARCATRSGPRAPAACSRPSAPQGRCSSGPPSASRPAAPGERRGRPRARARAPCGPLAAG
ncbi:MAG: hypothetical protein IIC31_09215, partial [Chloroflexi bacterium]|nr:hypothetical protein [Chloroflexota bacterium]